MVVGLGMDLCQIERMEKSMESPAFWQRVFGARERAALEALSPHRRAESAAACFAAKEAFLKAAGVGLGGFALDEIEALRRESGAPYYALSGTAEAWAKAQGITAWLTLTHEAGVAGAVALFEKNASGGD